MVDSHRISFEPVNIEMEVGEDEKILDAAFRQGIHLMHGCREGQCSTCAYMLLDGEVELVNNDILDEADLVEGVRLGCQSIPISDTVRLDFNV